MYAVDRGGGLGTDLGPAVCQHAGHHVACLAADLHLGPGVSLFQDGDRSSPGEGVQDFRVRGRAFPQPQQVARYLGSVGIRFGLPER